MEFYKDNDDLFDEIYDMDLRQTTTETDPKILTKKEVGDIITIIDYSAVSNEYGIEIEDNIINLNDEFIVIEVNQNHKFKSTIIYTQDLIVINRRTNIKYRVPYYYTRLK